MLDEHSRPPPGKAGPVTIIDTHEQIVRDYLNELEHPTPPKVFDPVEVTHGIDDPIDKLKALVRHWSMRVSCRSPDRLRAAGTRRRCSTRRIGTGT